METTNYVFWRLYLGIMENEMETIGVTPHPVTAET